MGITPWSNRDRGHKDMTVGWWQDESHAVLLHPRPFVKKHMVIIPSSAMSDVDENPELCSIVPHKFRMDNAMLPM